MSITRTTSRWSFTPNGVTTSFNFDNLVLDATDLTVSWVDSTGTALALPPWSVTGIGNPLGGTVVFETAPAALAGSYAWIERISAPVTTGTDQKDFLQENARTRQYYRDKNFALAQEAINRLKRTLQLASSDADGPAVLPAAAVRANKALGFDALGRPTVLTLTGSVVAASAWNTANFLPAATQAAARAVLGEGSISVLDPRFGVVADGSTDNATALELLAVYLRSLAYPPTVIWPPGVYKYSVSPNWAIANTRHVVQGDVRLRYTGTGNAVILDGSLAGGITMFFGVGGRFKVEAPATAHHAVYAHSIHHGHIGVEPRGAGTTYAGLKTHWCVCTQVDVKVSDNGEPWYLAAMPAIGVDLDVSATPGQLTSYCYFPNAIVEHVPTGIKCTGTLGNLFIGGTAEGCSLYGVLITSAGNGDLFYGMDWEANTIADVFNQGDGVEITDCDSTNTITFGATSKRGNLKGGKHKSILLDAGSRSHTVGPLEFNRTDAPGGTIVDSGQGNRIDWANIVDGTNNLILTRARRVVYFKDEFMGKSLDVRWQGRVGSDGACVAPAANVSIGGSVILKTGADAGGTMALNGTLLDRGALEWKMSNGGFWMEFRVGLLTITDCAWFVGITDQVAALEMPFTLSGVTLTSNASNGCGILFDTAATNDNWHLVGVAADVDATLQNTGVAPVADTYETWRIEISTAGTATFFRNGAQIGTAMSFATSGTSPMTPVFCGFSRAALQKSAYMDCIEIEAKRV